MDAGAGAGAAAAAAGGGAAAAVGGGATSTVSIKPPFGLQLDMSLTVLGVEPGGNAESVGNANW